MRISDWLGRFRRARNYRLGHTKHQVPSQIAQQIEPLEDRTLLTVFVVDSSADTIDANDGVTTLREAIEAANNNAGADSIFFNLPGNSLTIRPESALPTIQGDLTIDGTTQPGFNNTPLVELDGTNAGDGVDGLKLANDDNTIR